MFFWSPFKKESDSESNCFDVWDRSFTAVTRESGLVFSESMPCSSLKHDCGNFFACWLVERFRWRMSLDTRSLPSFPITICLSFSFSILSVLIEVSNWPSMDFRRRRLRLACSLLRSLKSRTRRQSERLIGHQENKKQWTMLNNWNKEKIYLRTMKSVVWFLWSEDDWESGDAGADLLPVAYGIFEPPAKVADMTKWARSCCICILVEWLGLNISHWFTLSGTGDPIVIDVGWWGTIWRRHPCGAETRREKPMWG